MGEDADRRERRLRGGLRLLVPHGVRPDHPGHNNNATNGDNNDNNNNSTTTTTTTTNDKHTNDNNDDNHIINQNAIIT